MSAESDGPVGRVVGANHVSTDPDVLAARSVDHTGRYRGRPPRWCGRRRPTKSPLRARACRDAGTYVTVQGGRTSLVAGTVPEHDDVLLSTERLRDRSVTSIPLERRVQSAPASRLPAVQRGGGRRRSGVRRRPGGARFGDGRRHGVDERGRPAHRSVREHGRTGHRARSRAARRVDPCSGTAQVRRDNTGYDLASLFVGAEGTLGVITALDLRLAPGTARTGSPRSPGSPTSTRWSQPAGRFATPTASRHWS